MHRREQVKEEQARGFTMRGAIWAMVLLLAPLASGLGLHPLPDDAAGGREALLVLDDGVWTSERWSMLEEQGVQPLRSVRSDALLVWMNAADNAQRWGPGISVEVPEPAELRLGLDSAGGPETTEFSSNLASRTAAWKRSNLD